MQSATHLPGRKNHLVVRILEWVDRKVAVRGGSAISVCPDIVEEAVICPAGLDFKAIGPFGNVVKGYMGTDGGRCDAALECHSISLSHKLPCCKIATVELPFFRILDQQVHQPPRRH
jgi:hypothetical protein